MKNNYQLGIDIGTSSIAVVAYNLNNKDEPISVLGYDSLIFGEPLVAGEFTLKNTVRRQKRLMRRQIERKKARVEKLLHLADWVGVKPAHLRESLKNLGRTTGVWQLRAEALEKPLSWSELFLVLLRVAKNRGYPSKIPSNKSSRIGDALRATDELLSNGKTLGQVLWERHRNDPRAGQSRFRKLAMSLDTLLKDKEQIQGTFVLREHIVAEFNLIMDFQVQHHPELDMPLIQVFGEKASDLLREKTAYFWGHRPNTLREALELVLFYQYPLKSYKLLIGECELIAGDIRVSTAHPSFQRFRLAELIANLRWKKKGAKKSSLNALLDLTYDQKQTIRQLLVDNEEISFTDLYDMLKAHGCPAPEGYISNYQTIRCTALKGDVLSHAWRIEGILPQWQSLSTEEQAQVITVLSDELPSPEQWVHDETKERIAKQVSPAVLAFLDLLTDGEGRLKRLASYKLPNGRAAYGAKACDMLVEYMRDYDCDKAQAEALLVLNGIATRKNNIQSQSLLAVLPHPNTLNIYSPVVKRALSESYKLFQDFFRRYGLPKTARIELMREMRQTLEKRNQISKNQGALEKSKKRIREKLIKHDKVPSDTNVRRIMLWEEQAEFCPYSGQHIDFSDAVDSSKTNFEHIIPKKVHGVGNRRDDVVLALANYNNKKSDETPWGAAQKYPNEWDWGITQGVCQRIIRNNFRFKYKADLILNPVAIADVIDELDDEMVDQQYSDTAWIARIIHQWFKAICEDVVVIRGGVTAYLRREWGLDTVLQQVRVIEKADGGEKGKKLFFEEFIDRHGQIHTKFKKRIDHRHHLIDAAVIGLSSRSMYHRVLKQRSIGKKAEPRDNSIPCPIVNLRDALVSLLQGYVVWHKPERLISGRMWDEEPFALNGERLYKRGKDAGKAFKPDTYKVLEHYDRHGYKHTKILAKAEFACMRIMDTTRTFLTIAQFQQLGYVRNGQLNVPKGERLIFKGDIFFSPKYKQFFKVAYFVERDGLMCIRVNETHTFDQLKGTALTQSFNSLKDLHQIRVFSKKQELAQFIRQQCDET